MASPPPVTVSPLSRLFACCAGKTRGGFCLWLALLVAVNLLARLPLCWDPATVDNDGAEYLAITRHLRAGEGYLTDLKWQFYTADPVKHRAWADRPPLYPGLALGCQTALRWLDPIAAARVGNAFLACVALWLCALYLRRLYGERIALFATGFVFLLPHTLKWTTQPMTETVTLLLCFGALLAWSFRDTEMSGAPAVAAGGLSAIAYLARPTGGLLVGVFLLDLMREYRLRKRGSEIERPPRNLLADLLHLVTHFLSLALIYHLLLWVRYGNPFHSALGFTFAVKTYYEVSYYGYGVPPPTTGEFLRAHWFEVPGLVLQQVWRHVQIVVPQLLPFLPGLGLLRKGDWSGNRWAGGATVAAFFLAHTVTWAAWGSSRYFLVCLPILVATLLSALERTDAPAWAVSYRRWVPGVAALGLAACVGAFYVTQSRPDRGLPELPKWRRGAEVARGLGLIASDKPAILNLLDSAPAVRLPRTTDTALLERFIREYSPAVLVFFDDEPAERPMAAAWRAGQLPTGWRLVVDEPGLLVARRAEESGRLEAPGGPGTN